MNALQIFKNDQFGEIRTVEENGTALFCGSDIAKALGYVSPRKCNHGTLQRGHRFNDPFGWRNAEHKVYS